jgi:hypothetical protein
VIETFMVVGGGMRLTLEFDETHDNLCQSYMSDGCQRG